MDAGDQTSTHPAQNTPPLADLDTLPDPLLHASWWPPLAAPIEQQPSLATARVNAGDLIDRALFHAETTAACWHSVPPPPSRGDLQSAAAAENPGGGRPHACPGWHAPPFAAMPAPWASGASEACFRAAPWRPRSSDAVAAGGADCAPHPGAPWQ